jgi:hypothetical protein
VIGLLPGKLWAFANNAVTAAARTSKRFIAQLLKNM